MVSRYAELGVDVKKRGIDAFRKHLSNLFPNAFCTVQQDPDYPDKGLVSHTDSAGSKPVQSYLHWKENGDFGWYEGLAQDVVAMNLDDIICVGADPLCFLDYVAVNSLRLPREPLLQSLAQGFADCLSTLKENNCEIAFSGGETADLPDQIRTLDVSGCIFGRVALSKVITGSTVADGDRIIGLRSGGKTKLERRENSGIMCNGLTLARLCLMSKDYGAKHPELSETKQQRYRGRYRFDQHVEALGMTVGEALLSPTRLYAPVVKKVLQACGSSIHALVHNTGGGQTKCLRVGRNIHFHKESLPKPDPIFLLVQEESRTEWREMYEVFNMGIGFEVIAEPPAVDKVLDIADFLGFDAKVIGRCSRSPEGNVLTIRSGFGTFEYR